MIVIGNSSNPRNHIAPIAQRIKTINKIEFVFPDLKDKRGNFIKCIGLIIKNKLMIKELLKSLDPIISI